MKTMEVKLQLLRELDLGGRFSPLLLSCSFRLPPPLMEWKIAPPAAHRLPSISRQ